MCSKTMRTVLGLIGVAMLGGCSQSQPPAGRNFTASFDAPMPEMDQWLTIAQTNPSKALATWKIQKDPAAPSRPSVLALTQTQNTGGTFNLAIFKKTSMRDLDLSVKTRADTGTEDQGGGLIWRCRDANNYYVCRLNPLEHNFRVYKVADGKRSQFASADTDAPASQWHTIRVTMVGPQMDCYLNGQKLLSVSDETFRDAGQIGLWTKADAASSFDDLVARELPVPQTPAR